MIERLRTTLRAIAARLPSELTSDDSRRLAADCADAIRLELDCPQQELTVDQRRALVTLGDALETSVEPSALRDVALTASKALGVGPAIEFRRAANADSRLPRRSCTKRSPTTG